MLACRPTRFLASTRAHPANATPWLQSPPHTLKLACGLLLHSASPVPDRLTQVTTIRFPAQSAASAHRKEHSIPIFLPR
jgi:hypothetical protein